VEEDDDAVRRLTVRVLSAQGYEVVSAPNAQRAQLVFDRRDGAVDLLVTDLVMPAGGGHELYEQLSQRQPSLRVLYMSGYSEEWVPRTELARRLLRKPFTPEALLASVRDLLAT